MPRGNTNRSDARDVALHQTNNGLIGHPTGTLLSQWEIMRQSARAHNNAVRARLAELGRYSPPSVIQVLDILEQEARRLEP